MLDESLNGARTDRLRIATEQIFHGIELRLCALLVARAGRPRALPAGKRSLHATPVH